MADICSLTLREGRFVDSHLFPKALTKVAIQRVPLIQGGNGSRPVRRWSSWSDKKLVTEAGEEILASLDNWGITELRKLKLLWTGWGPITDLGTLHKKIGDSQMGVRELHVADRDRMRLFFLSILWRAAATSRKEFSDVSIPSEDLEKLRQMIVDGKVDPLGFYPTTLIQFSTLGEVHNFAPLAGVKTNPAFGHTPERKIPIFRFYFDGLVAHTHRESRDADGYTKALASQFVGGENRLLVTTLPYEESFEQKNLDLVRQATDENWPEAAKKLYGGTS